MKDTFDVHAWNISRYLNENKGTVAANKVIKELRSTVITKLDDEELTEFRKILAEAFDMSLNKKQD